MVAAAAAAPEDLRRAYLRRELILLARSLAIIARNRSCRWAPPAARNVQRVQSAKRAA